MSRGSPSSSSIPLGKLSSGRARKGNTPRVHGARGKWGISSWQRGIQFEFIVYFPGRLCQKILEKLLKYRGTRLLSVFEFATESQRKWMGAKSESASPKVISTKNEIGKLLLFSNAQNMCIILEYFVTETKTLYHLNWTVRFLSSLLLWLAFHPNKPHNFSERRQSCTNKESRCDKPTNSAESFENGNPFDFKTSNSRKATTSDDLQSHHVAFIPDYCNMLNLDFMSDKRPHCHIERTSQFPYAASFCAVITLLRSWIAWKILCWMVIAVPICGISSHLLDILCTWCGALHSKRIRLILHRN